QKSWTSEDPSNDSRSVRLQLESEPEDFQHMEPVLVRKTDLNLNMYSSLEYPKNFFGDSIWADSYYVVVAVIKIHFRPYTIKMNSHETRVIKKLSRSLGTELLSYQLRQDSMKAMQDLSRDRLNACNILADSLRNAITKSGMIFTLVKQEVAYLREQWEALLINSSNEENPKITAINRLNSILEGLGDEYWESVMVLRNAHERFMELSLPPSQGENWVKMQIEEKWDELFNQGDIDNETRGLVSNTIDDLKQALRFGKNPKITAGYNEMPEELKDKWAGLIYEEVKSMNDPLLDRLISILGNPELNIPCQEKSRKALLQLKALADTMGQLERNTNFLLHQVLNGSAKKELKDKIYDFLNDNSRSAIPGKSRLI
ncbi:MAG: hypothetical protein PVG39_22765, partial [Desulfobacteraceae bacterium]